MDQIVYMNYLNNLTQANTLFTKGVRNQKHETKWDKNKEIMIIQCWFIHKSCRRRCSIEKRYSYKFCKIIGKHLCQSLFFNKVAGWGLQLYEKEILAQVFSCDVLEISQNTTFTDYLRATLSVYKSEMIKLQY